MRQSVCRRVWLGGAASISALGVDVRPASGQFVNVLPEDTQSRRTAAHFQPTPRDGLIANTFAQPELRHTVAREAQAKPQMGKWLRVLRADVYDELLKLPLRFALHDFRRLQAHMHMIATHEAGAGATCGTSLGEGMYTYTDACSNDNGNKSHKRGDGDDGCAGNDDEDDDVATAVAKRVYAVAGRTSGVGYAPPLGPADPLDTIPFFVHRNSNGRLPGRIISINAKTLIPSFYMMVTNIEGDIFRFEEELMKIFPTKRIFVRKSVVYVYSCNLDALMVLHHWLLGLGF